MNIDKTLEILDSTDFAAIRKVTDSLITEGQTIVPDIIATLDQASTRQTLNLITVLIEIGDQRAVESICNLLRTDSTAMIRSKSAEALGTFADTTALPALIEALHRTNESEMVLMWVVDSIGHIRNTSSYDALIDFLEQTHSKTMTYMTIRALGTQGNPQAIKHILNYLNDSDHHVRRDSEIALKKLGDSSISTGDV